MGPRFLLVGFIVLYLLEVESLWWAAGRHLVMDPMRICRKTRRLRGKQAHICAKEPEIVRAIGKGSQLGLRECQHQFRNRRWNCTSARRSLRKVLLRDTRETAFVNAITSAGVAYGVTQSCTVGKLPDCTCDRRFRGVNTAGGWDWGGCGDNIDFGYRKSKEFMEDRFRKRSDIKTMVLKHNFEAGRLAVRHYMRIVCKCHGMSGSCTIKSCWRKLPQFRDVGNFLKDKFDGAAKVMAGNDGKGFIPEGSDSIKPPGKEDIVYSEESPSFCDYNRKTGSIGTQGRACNHTSMGVDGCELLCCGRGFETLKQVEEVTCKCRFRWCCDVHCETCLQKKIISKCL